MHMKYVILETGGKQYKVSEGDIIEIEKINTEPGDIYTFEKVLLYTADGIAKIGQPSLDDISVTAKILEQKKGKKIRVAKFKAKSIACSI